MRKPLSPIGASEDVATRALCAQSITPPRDVTPVPSFHWPTPNTSYYLLKVYEWNIATVIFGRASPSAVLQTVDNCTTAENRVTRCDGLSDGPGRRRALPEVDFAPVMPEKG